MAGQGPYSYKPNVNRAVTKKWRDANQANYDGDDWGEDDYEEPVPRSADNIRHPGWEGQGQIYPGNRSMTNPSPTRSGGGSSFDQGDDRRYYSGAGGFDSAYPTSQKSPFPEPQHDYEPPMVGYRSQPPLQVHTTGQGPYHPSGFRPGSRGQQYPTATDGPFSAPGGYPHRRNQPSDISSRGDMMQRNESPGRPDSRGSNNSGRYFPPRKSSLSQQQPPSDIPSQISDVSSVPQSTASAPGEVKALPFIRPADIYKRIEEEREKERRSQESSRRSLDSANSKTRDHSTGPTATTAEATSVPEIRSDNVEDSEAARRGKSTLDTVVERKSEYGFDNLLKRGDQNEQSLSPDYNLPGGVSRHNTTASSVYSDRPDPVSASDISRNTSMRESGLPNEVQDSPQSKRYNLPQINRISSFGQGVGDFTFGSYSAENSPPRPTQESRGVPVSNEATGSEPHFDHRSIARQDEGLQHQPSLGYKSAVAQAFDNSQILSPVSTSDTIPRSNSASTSDISPIVSRKQENIPDQSLVGQTIPEESANTMSRPTSSSTLKANEGTRHEQPLPPTPTVQHYRSERNIPSPENNPAKKALNVQTANDLHPAQAVIATVGDNKSPAEANPIDFETKSGEKSIASTTTDRNITNTSSQMIPSDERTNSEEWREWQNQRRQFNAQVGLQGSNFTTPDVPSPISRTETPAKGTVKGLAGKLEDQSGRSSPLHGGHLEQDSDPLRPPQTRFDSFRPSIPGGWQSYSATPAATSPSQEVNKQLQPLNPPKATRFDSSDSIPRAKPPQQRHEDDEGPLRGAFAAAVAAGSALAGAFSGPALSRSMTSDSQDTSDNEWDASSTDSSRLHPVTSESRDFAMLENSPLAGGQGAYTVTSHDESDQMKAHRPPTDERSVNSYDSSENAQTPKAQTFGSQHTQTSATSAEPRAGDLEETPKPPPKDNVEAISQDQTFRNKSKDAVQPNSGGEPFGSHDSDPTSQPPVGESDVPAPLRTSKLFGPATIIRPPIPNVSGSSESPLEDDNESLQRDIVNSLSPPRPSVSVTAAENEAEKDAAIPQEPHPFGLQSETSTVAVGPHHMNSKRDGDRQILPGKEQDQNASLSQGPILERRFSWQMDSDEPNASSPAGESGSLKSRSFVPASIVAQPAQAESAAAAVQADITTSASRGEVPDDEARHPVPRPISKDGRLSSTSKKLAKSSNDHPTLRSILNLDTVHQRIKAFDDSRASYATSDGLLDEWLNSMRTSEHPDLFQDNTHPTPSRNESASNYKPSPRRETGGGSKLMQEDGKRLMAAAGRFGGKAGVAAKGLFAKGKDKLRTASAGDKGSRRKSTGPAVSKHDDSQHEPQGDPRHKSTREPDEPKDTISNPPQIPPQDLSLSPVTAGDWSLPSGLTKSPNDLESANTGPNPGTGLVVPEAEEAKTVIPDSENDTLERHDSFTSPEDRVSGAIPKAMLCDIEQGDVEQDDEPPHASKTTQVASEPSGPSVSDVVPQKIHDSEHKATEPDQNPLAGGKGQPSQTEPTSLDPGLAIPDEQRSVVSKVSSVSPNLEPEVDNTHAHRSISPAEDHQPHSETIPSYNDVSNVNPVETSVEKPQDDTLPSYKNEDGTGELVDQKRIPPDSKIIPIADLSAQKRQQRATTQNRPFSFNGAEHLHLSGQHRSAAEELQQPVQSPSAGSVDQPLSKPPIVGDINGGDQNRPQVKSYSRPFVGNSNIPDSSSGQQDEHDRTQRYSTNSPLPSARRSPEELTQQRQVVPRTTQPEEEGYRIPGPYGQEYRSPKQASTPRHTWDADDESKPYGSGANNEDASVPAHQQHQQPSETQASEEQWRQQEQVENQAASPSTKPRQRSFGGLFKPRWNRSQQNLSEAALNDANTDKQKRSSVFRRDSRNDSLNSHSSNFLEKRDQVGELPRQDAPNRSRKRLSKEILRTGTPDSFDRSEGKKKRFSGVSSLFSKRSSKDGKEKIPERSSTVPIGAKQSNRTGTETYGSNGTPSHEQRQYPEASRPNGQFQGIPPPAGGYYGPNRPLSQQYEYQNPSYGQYAENGYQRYDQGYNHRLGEKIDANYNYSSPTSQNPNHRPTNLHIDTGRSSPKIHGMAHTGPPQSYANRDISYESRPTASQIAGPVSSGPQRQSRQDSSSHVVDLHKRSRSPRLGRKSSSEDLMGQARNEQLGTQAPAVHLGTFTSKKVSPLGGIARPDEDQEAPYRIGIPGEQSEERRRKTRQALIENGSQSKDTINGGSTSENAGRKSTDEAKTVAQRIIGPQVPDSHHKSLSNKSPLQATHANANSNAMAARGPFVAELPGSKAEGYESEEEIPMSATFYPGQEWQPIYVGDDRWDD